MVTEEETNHQKKFSQFLVQNIFDREYGVREVLGVTLLLLLFFIIQQCFKIQCNGFAMVLEWSCYGVAMALQWFCYGLAIVLQWSCYGLAMILQWSCNGLVKVNVDEI